MKMVFINCHPRWSVSGMRGSFFNSTRSPHKAGMTMMVFILLSLIPLPTFAQEAEEPVEEEIETGGGGFTVDDLVYDCKKCSIDEKSSECIFCNGILTGVATTLALKELGKTFCPPNDLDTHKTRNFFRKWALHEGKRNPEARQMPAVMGVVEAMHASFPCGR